MRHEKGIERQDKKKKLKEFKDFFTFRLKDLDILKR